MLEIDVWGIFIRGSSKTSTRGSFPCSERRIVRKLRIGWQRLMHNRKLKTMLFIQIEKVVKMNVISKLEEDMKSQKMKARMVS